VVLGTITGGKKGGRGFFRGPEPKDGPGGRGGNSIRGFSRFEMSEFLFWGREFLS